MFYTFLIQHTTSKKAYSFILEDVTPESLYHKFNINLEEDTKDGEYEYVLIENPEQVAIDININDIFKSTLVEGDTVIETYGLLTIGNDTERTVYNKQQDYIVYGS